MKERPILMSAPMVRAILEGRKTQTRRIVKPQPQKCQMLARDAASPSGYSLIADAYEDEFLVHHFGDKGDRLWVKETWRTSKEWDHLAPTKLPFAGESLCEVYLAYAADGKSKELHGKTRVSIHMPRWASRLTLDVTAVRVERLQDISDEDAIAEGIERADGAWASYDNKLARCVSPVTSYRTLWESINGPGSWAANPWLWCISFKRIEA